MKCSSVVSAWRETESNKANSNPSQHVHEQDETLGCPFYLFLVRKYIHFIIVPVENPRVDNTHKLK